MAISESARADLYTGLSEVLGRERTETLMSALPPYQLDEVATKGDIAALRADIDDKFRSFQAELDGRFESFRAELDGWFESFQSASDSRFERLESRFESLQSASDSRFERLEIAHQSLAARMGKIEEKLDRLQLVLIAGLFGIIATLIGIRFIG